MGFSHNVQQFLAGANAGLVVEGLLPKLLLDTFSIDTIYTSYQSDYHLPGLTPSLYSTRTEWITELNYSININKSIRIISKLQVVFNPGGGSNRSAMIVAGSQV